jgi:uncharacterized damage-inducible protein DinB
VSQIKQYEESIVQSLAKMVELVKDLPEEQIRWKPSAEEWSVMETLCHVEEAAHYWLDELERVVAHPSEWGRGIQDEKRLAAVAQADQRQVADVLSKVGQIQDRVKEVFAKLSDEQMKIEAPHRNPKFGVKPVSFLVEHFLVEHMDIHVKQIQRVMKQYEERHA